MNGSRLLAWLALTILVVTSGCITIKIRGTVGASLIEGMIERITPGVTTFSEVLEWLGPPDYIIDGTKELADPFAPGANPICGVIPTRTLSAPDGEVILIYLLSAETSSKILGVAVAASVVRVQHETKENELFVYLSKQTRTVVDLAMGVASE